jgi:hypothetical protein
LLVLGSVTLVKSNAKALLTDKPIKNATCEQVLRSLRSRRSFLKKATCTLQKLYCVTVCVDGDGVFDTAPTP